VNPEDVAARICAVLPDAQIELTGVDCSFGLTVVSELLAGQSAVARQRLLLALFATELASGQLHALSICARTPAEVRDAAPETQPTRVSLSTLPGE
jgi:BolA protein